MEELSRVCVGEGGGGGGLLAKDLSGRALEDDVLVSG